MRERTVYVNGEKRTIRSFRSTRTPHRSRPGAGHSSPDGSDGGPTVNAGRQSAHYHGSVPIAVGVGDQGGVDGGTKGSGSGIASVMRKAFELAIGNLKSLHSRSIALYHENERDYDVYKEALKSTSLPLLSEVYLQMSRKDATKPYGVHCDFLPSHTSAKESHSTCTCAFCCGWMSDLTPAQVKALSSRTGEPFPHNAKYRYKRCTNPACPLSKSTSPDTSGVIAINRDANSAVHFLQDTRLVRAGLSPQKAQETRVGWAMSGKAAKPKPVKSQQPGTKRQRRC